MCQSWHSGMPFRHADASRELYLVASPEFKASAIQQLSSEGIAILFHAKRSSVRAPAAHVLPCGEHVGYNTRNIWTWISSQAFEVMTDLSI